ncbi:YceI family protein [Blastopirellula marina]|uniref:Lipid/polyisoprenoid-binding YceI-like domain-containing protein n=1 Tax=Blastopirellula marina TaxID=124 RepID=A0A2S8GQ08_9BACT|nr:YceI family protein [Blastopirellula marina]PQO46510.1 hypothetical protein C5Y93_08525 [Blastopirellula marina]
MLRLFGLLMIAGIVCLGCKPPETETTSSGDADGETEKVVATESLPSPEKPEEAAMPEEPAKPEEPKAETPKPEEKPAEKPAEPMETPQEEPKPEATPEVDPNAAAQPTPADSVEGLMDEAPAPEAKAEMAKPEETTETVAVEASGPVEMKLTPDNTLIQFVGTHVGDKPDPRTGKFGKFSGTAKAADGKLTAVMVTIDATSIETEFEKLTNHLKSPDFFDVRAHPEAKFESTKIEYGDDGTAKITGDLTMLKETKSVSFPAKVTVGKDIKLDAEFVIDRVEFGMDYSPDKVSKDVTMTIKVGK